MGIISIFLIALGLSMDAFAVSVSNGIAIPNYRPKDGTRMAIFFGTFQCAMPIIGWVLGSSIKSYIEAVDHFIAFILLGFIGVNMIRESFKHDDEDKKEVFELTNKKLILQSIATSIDALAIGISFAVLDVDIISSSIIIGVVCAILAFIGGSLGRKLGGVLKGKAELFGGLILVAIGTKILIEHLFFL